jgi:hypothetical protein
MQVHKYNSYIFLLVWLHKGKNSRVKDAATTRYGVNTRPVMTTIEQFRYHLQSQVILSEGKENHQKQNTNTERDRQLHQTYCMDINCVSLWSFFSCSSNRKMQVHKYNIYFYLYDYTKAKIDIPNTQIHVTTHFPGLVQAMQ